MRQECQPQHLSLVLLPTPACQSTASLGHCPLRIPSLFTCCCSLPQRACARAHTHTHILSLSLSLSLSIPRAELCSQSPFPHQVLNCQKALVSPHLPGTLLPAATVGAPA
jgi:hypothetical protein